MSPNRTGAIQIGDFVRHRIDNYVGTVVDTERDGRAVAVEDQATGDVRWSLAVTLAVVLRRSAVKGIGR